MIGRNLVDVDNGDTSWMQLGRCVGMDAQLMFPERGDSVREAKLVCATCPVAKACLDYAIRNSEKFGIWGGKSERERRRIAKDRRARGEIPPARTHKPKPVDHGAGTSAWQNCRKLNGKACDRCQTGHARANAEREERAAGATPPRVLIHRDRWSA